MIYALKAPADFFRVALITKLAAPVNFKQANNENNIYNNRQHRYISIVCTALIRFLARG
ncbi:hypothetical protein NTGBS_960003 [Candidatus Nitrotoga sp. BS]|nr:hypothetical protein NTGBS_960003 [Candidatus Nitrotoga sp. BS]